MFDTKKFGAYISQLRKNADITQSDLAAKLNLTRQAVSKYEVGDSFPDISTLVLIAENLNTTTDDLIKSGDPTKGEAKIFKNILQNETGFTASYDVKDIFNVAPFIKPSTLDRLALGLKEQESWTAAKECIDKYFIKPETIHTDIEQVWTGKMKYGIHKIKTWASGSAQLIPNEIHNEAWKKTDEYATKKYGIDYVHIPGYSRFTGPLEIYKLKGKEDVE